MRLWRFLKLEKPYLVLYATGFLLTIAIAATDPHTSLHGFTIVYALLLNLIVLIGFLIYRYMMNLRAIRLMYDEDNEPLTLESEAYREAHEQETLAHIRALNEVQAKQKEHYDFIISWFHEIKTPISVLRLMQQTEVDSRSLEEELSRIEQYVDQALYYAKLDSFNQDYEIVNCDLELLAKTAVKSHAKAFISNKIKLKLDIPSIIVQSDPKWLLFILNQLITNSLKYSAAANGEISITARITQHEKLLVIRDNGIGINATDIPRIFNRGFTGTNGRTHTKSTGMGLYLAQELSRKLGHYLTCESEIDRFTAITIHFPKHHDPYLRTVMQKPQ
ncbi:integral membrane sensor signal transduction histidine kinase [Paenibacillus curdlanolyticus YK9]|uniref:histidine kinase n=1 Tax=Paenibacillus curdlanolyticus YK9 TaxID=717606 RepID=E0I9S4_9BACL|nr:sensor histidine kinase [Paenibacillus curdlanolyticus]EFM11158.1 integral membrane sensor signal transduction histidine kinase [Paenibacillus curdlanolyticus YK9]